MVPYSYKASDPIQDFASTSLSAEKNPAGTQVDPKTKERDLSSDEYCFCMDLARELARPEWAYTGMGPNAKKALRGDMGARLGFMTPQQIKTCLEKGNGWCCPSCRLRKGMDE